MVGLNTVVGYEEELDIAIPPCLPTRCVSVKVSEPMCIRNIRISLWREPNLYRPEIREPLALNAHHGLPLSSSHNTLCEELWSLFLWSSLP